MATFSIAGLTVTVDDSMGIDREALAVEIQPLCGRLVMNRQQTGHAFHHLTRSGAITNRDLKASPDDVEHLWHAGISIAAPRPAARPKGAVELVSDWHETHKSRRWRSTPKQTIWSPLPKRVEGARSANDYSQGELWV